MMEFMGQGGFVWWFGVVEDTNDPLKLGRIRVRIFGYHTESKGSIRTSDLPWAHPLQDITSASISGVGRSPTGLVTGSHVFGFFRDGMDAQQPVVMFSVGGIPAEKADKTKGFNDPTGVFPTEVDVPDTNRLATGEETEKTIVEGKKLGVDKLVPVAWDSLETQRWNEPTTPYKTEYPNNKVFATRSGMVEEWDDTPNKERHHTYHPSGSFEEVANGWENDPNGTRVHKVTGNNYELIAGSDYVHIKGTAKITVDGDVSVLVGPRASGGNLNIQVDGNVNLQALKDVRGIVYGSWDLSVLGDHRETIIGNKYTRVFGNCVTDVVSGGFVVSSLNDAVIKTKIGSDLYVSGKARSIKLNSLARTGEAAADPFIIPGIYPIPFGA
jgi:hypothetical protein